MCRTLLRTHGLTRDTVLRMAGADDPSRAPITLLTLNSRENMGRFAIGCDSDIGGMSWEEACQYRLELMEERTQFVSVNGEAMFGFKWNMCEH